MLTNHFRRIFVLFVVVGLMTAVLNIVTAVTAQPTTSPPAPDERALLPHLATSEADAGVSSALLYPPDWSKGVFQSYRDGNWEIYSSQPPHRLTNHGSSDMQPRYNRGATRVVFSSNRDGDYEIFVMNADGSGLQQLTHNGANDVNPVWSPDGSQIAFQSYRDGQAEVYVMDANGSNQQRLTAHGNYDGEPTWSPDGSQIAFTSARTGTPYIYVMNSDGTGVTQLSNQPSVYPAWSPDGSQIAYSGDQDGDGWLELWLMNADGSNQHMLYDPYEVQADAWAHGWSPDGREITFTLIKFIQYQGNWYWEWAQVVGYNLDTGIPSVLVYGNTEWHPDWQTTDVMPPQTEMGTISAYSQTLDFQVYWSGTDQESGAGLAAYDVQYKVGSSGPWVDWQMGVTTTSAAYTAVPGTTVSFRARAHDNAFNYEAWSTADNPTTTFYTWALEGKLTDNRGAPLAQAPLMISPLPLNEAITDGSGDFFSRLKTGGSHTLDVNRSGYGDLAPTSLNMENLAHIYLPPANNALLNGGFEATTPLDGWTTTGTVTAVTNPRHTGNNSALLIGGVCSSPCLTEGETLDGNLHQVDIVTDSQGGVHIIGEDNSSITYRTRAITGIWSGQQLSSRYGHQPRLTIDQNDNLYVFWTVNNRVYYRYKSVNGSWSSSTLLVTLPIGPEETYRVVKAAADSKGTLHLLIEQYGDSVAQLAFYLRRLPNGNWQPSVLLTSFGYESGSLTVGSDDTLHLVWYERKQETNPPEYSLVHQQQLADGSIINKTYLRFLSDLPQRVIEDMAISLDGVIHVTWSEEVSNHRIYHASRAVNGKWSEPTLIHQSAYSNYYDRGSDISVDAQGVVHAVVRGYANAGAYYRQWMPDDGWQPEIPLTSVAHDSPQTAVDRYDIVHLLLIGITATYYRSLPATTNNTAVLSQQVTIPANMPAPTLAFMAQRPGDVPGDGSGLELLVSDGVTTTAVPLATGSAAWTHYWADMSPWAGQAVTVNFRLTQVSGDPRVQAAIDDVTLGSAYPDTWVSGAGPASALPGETVVFHLQYGNNGRVPAADGELALTWPDALTFVAASVTPTMTANTLTWHVGELVEEAAPVTIVVTATVAAATPYFTTINLPLSLTSATSEVEQQNNQAIMTLLIAHRLLLPVLHKP
ncbi:MAG: PD40 domain-containing protein [Anaerolinea sp.]|nr:PD40 domain-containing protein [Anaerolinea sp.]